MHVVESAMNTFIILLFCFTFGQGKNHLRRRVIGGHPAAEDAFPFVVAIFTSDGIFSSRNSFQCTGSVIHQRWILTAAHCLKEYPWVEFSISVGHILVRNETRKFPVDNFYIHPKYQKTSKIIQNDVGLAHLKENLVWSSSVQKIPLGSIDDESEVFVRYIGYGDDSEDDDREDRRLNQIILRTVKFEECRQIHAKIYNTVDKSTQICAFGAINRTLCYGDSGGPLIDRRSGRQVGIFSSLNDCTGRYPVLFARVSHFLQWIRSTTNLSIF